MVQRARSKLSLQIPQRSVVASRVDFADYLFGVTDGRKAIRAEHESESSWKAGLTLRAGRNDLTANFVDSD